MGNAKRDGAAAGRAGAGRAGASELRGVLEVIGAMVLAGSSVVVGKVLSTRVPVFLSAELSLCAALLAIAPAQLARRAELRRVGRRELGYMFLQALFGIVLFRVLTLHGLRFTSASSAGLITSASPAIMAVCAALLLRERQGRREWAGIGLTVAGLLLVNGASLHAPGALRGNLLVLGATACEALLTIFRKSSGGRIGSVTNTTILAAMSALMLLPFALMDLRGFPLAEIDPTAWAALVYYGAFATVIAYVLWGHGALLIPAGRTGMATAAMPVSALVLSAVVLGERLGVLSVIGCAAVIGGIVVGSGRRKVKEPAVRSAAASPT
jgi:drug/metabolite transporter (DMT)-like permease